MLARVHPAPDAGARRRTRPDPGEIIVLPQANPLGLTHPNGFLLRLARRRDRRELQPRLSRPLPTSWAICRGFGADAAQNAALIREAMGRALAAMKPRR